MSTLTRFENRIRKLKLKLRLYKIYREYFLYFL